MKTNIVDLLKEPITEIETSWPTKYEEHDLSKLQKAELEILKSIKIMIIAIIVLVAGVTAIKESLEKILNPEEASYSVATLIIIAVAVVVKFVFGRYVKKTGEKINSGSLVASGSDAIFDSVLSLSTFVAAVISLIWHISLEGFLGVIIGLFIIKSSIEMIKDTMNDVIGTRIDNELSKKIKDIINSFNEVQGAYDLILHSYGPTKMIGSVHIQVDDKMTAKEIHGLTKEIEGKVFSELGIILTIGIYASNTDDKETAKIKNELHDIVKKYESIIQLHGFYVDTKTNTIMFDLIIDFKDKNAEETKDKVIAEIAKKYPKYRYSAIIDKDFSD